MNTERMLYLADQLDNPTDPKLTNVSFHMDDFSTDESIVEDAIVCGTAACIGGHAVILFGGTKMWITERNAQAILDLTSDQVNDLFYDFSLRRAEAAERIREMVKEENDRH